VASKTRTFDPAEARERAQERMQQALTLLEDSISSILDSESFARYLRAMSRFHHYSAHNVALILAQRPEATRVAGYRAWQQLGRQVRKGEKGLVILVPLISRVKGGGDAEADKQEEREERVVTRFSVGYVFDVSQTDGEPLPDPPAVQAITGATDRGAALWDALADWLAIQGVKLEIKDCGRPNGSYAPVTKAIVVHERLIGTDQATKTLAHEAAHYVADHRCSVPKEDAETVAEGAAYVVLHHFGLDTSGYSFPYVARWAEDKVVLKRNLDAIRQAADAIIGGIEMQMGEQGEQPLEPAA
jgi:antirestriction protein ArdC